MLSYVIIMFTILTVSGLCLISIQSSQAAAVSLYILFWSKTRNVTSCDNHDENLLRTQSQIYEYPSAYTWKLFKPVISLKCITSFRLFEHFISLKYFISFNPFQIPDSVRVCVCVCVWGGGGVVLMGCVQSWKLKARRARVPRLPRFILLGSFSDTLLVDIVYDGHL